MRKKTLIIVGIISLVIFGKLLFGAAFFGQVLFQVIFNREIDLKKANSHVNVLLLGIAGGSHDGPSLTDTIIFSSIDEVKNKATLISLPRDLWVPDLEQKINTAYTIGESKRKGGGIVLAKAVVSKVLNRPIDYVVRIDFDGFVKAIDLIGGLSITVDRTFDDYEYPVEEKREDLCGHTLDEATAQIATLSATVVFPCRYIHVHFDKGLVQMDGSKALVFVRSRNAEGEEGTDFSRSMRQQKIIKAFKDKIFSPGTFLNPIKITNLYNVLKQSIDTDIKQSEFDDFIKLGQKMKDASIVATVIDTEDEEKNKKGLLINPPSADFGGTWVLIPRIGNGNFSEIQAYVQCVLIKDVCQIK